MATVTVNGLQCGVTYTIIAGGTLNGDLVGLRSSHGNVTTGPCPEVETDDDGKNFFHIVSNMFTT